jgi:hypothetical protein
MQGINASRIRSCFTKIKNIKIKICLRNVSTSTTLKTLLYFPLYRTVGIIQLLPLALVQTAVVTVSPFSP